MTLPAEADDLKALVRTIPDFPKPGIMFRDITTLFGDARASRRAWSGWPRPIRMQGIEAVAGIEARGFILGGAVADRLGTGFVPIRKKGKLPAKAIGEEYELEYGVDAVELHEDAIRPGERILLVDDLIATGGTAAAAARLIEKAGGVVAGAAFIIDLPDLGGCRKLAAQGVTCHTLIEFEGD